MDRLSLRGMGKALLPGSVQGRKKGGCTAGSEGLAGGCSQWVAFFKFK
jgi:hypothetical protein